MLMRRTLLRGCFHCAFLTSKERDTETGLDYFGARYYGSNLGRFTSPDPLLESGRAIRPQSWNRYAYVLNNPLRFVDPDGLIENDPNDQETQEKQKQQQQQQSSLQVNDVSVFNGTFPKSSGPVNNGQQAVNPNGTSSVLPYGFNLSVDYTLTKNDKPVAGVKIVETVKVEFEQIVSDKGKLETQKGVAKFSGPVSEKPTDKAGNFTDAPIGASSDTPYTSVKVTQTLYSVGKNGVKQELATNTLTATTDYKIVNNKVTGSGRTTVSFSNPTYTKTLTLPRPTKIN